MNTSDFIALAAMGVAALAALYARWSAAEAKRANRIALQRPKLDIYEEAISFSECFTGLFCVPTAARLETFKKRAVQAAEIHLSQEVFLQLKAIYDHCAESEVWLQIAQRAEVEGRQHDDIPNELEVRAEYKAVRDLLYPAIESIKREVKIDPT